ncbi:MAG TPA: F0F1 ATP synthase subunit epsilon [Henriciella marina]|uniref:F0F1 ATP synthase subunit epsilon n=1 Tax=Henriciella sp. TaxID=1968823 RepID=UPI001821422A|nr:F0F1 ATP synthase subunit epsilon [Henriciella sp.]HIG21138.1 F0F1 ATP synthase subunit epsilon [Henriciella sp.]HIK64323.1 F0F1 ATP synthase subunit epsilon [Henriciella marina]
MASKLHFSLVSPAKELFSGEVDHVIAPGTEGEFGVLVNHAPFMTTLKNGVVRVLENDTTKMRLFVRGGFADVTPAGLTILAEEAVDLSSVDAAKVDAELEEAKNKLAAEGKEGPHVATLRAQVDYLSDLKSAIVH